MAQSYRVNSPRFNLVSVDSFSVGSDYLLDQVTLKELTMTESLLTPSVQTSVRLQSKIYGGVKWFGTLKNQTMSITLSDEARRTMVVSQKIYRMDNRQMMPMNVGQTEEFSLHCCDQTLLNDAKSLVSKSWKCTQPSSIVSEVLRQCVGANRTDVENTSGEPRDYIAENIHPFQVIAQQANVALASGDDPSFVHFMTYDGVGATIHNFKSLKSMIGAGSIGTFFHSETSESGTNNYSYADKNRVLDFSFPCDFDYLTDLLNGINESGQSTNALAVVNQLTGMFSLLGNQAQGCGIGGSNFKLATTNYGSAEQQNSCNVGVEKHLLKRQARMSLLDRDKVALRLVLPWNPQLHAGRVINFQWRDKESNNQVYGTGKYLIASMTHTIRPYGFSTTTVDCVAQTALTGA